MAWCAVINETLSVDVCPIPDSSCFFKHRVSGICKAKECAGKTGNDLAEIVGLDPITEEQYTETFNSLKTGLYNEET